MAAVPQVSGGFVKRKNVAKKSKMTCANAITKWRKKELMLFVLCCYIPSVKVDMKHYQEAIGVGGGA